MDIITNFLLLLLCVLNNPISGKCVDKSIYCEASKDYCLNNYYLDWMKINCQKLCGFCKEVTTTTTTPEPTTEIISEICEDLQVWCITSELLCKNPYYTDAMKLNCRKTCNLCDAITTSTSTIQTTTTPNTTTTPRPTTTKSTSADFTPSKTLCQILKVKKNYCVIEPKFMIKHCSHTCVKSNCADTISNCSDLQSLCDIDNFGLAMYIIPASKKYVPGYSTDYLKFTCYEDKSALVFTDIPIVGQNNWITCRQANELGLCLNKYIKKVCCMTCFHI
ncbi:hypothetical protein A3Q56_02589 [Intoshia linei]|uniref:ShKT domain-containing protein n=1 Tax=Intoshia linei TaxID=1819745 RepID=A0A177B5W1_9BILA|nr:hypothetical protein A3Q56_02589 [Intoshia linei]